MFCSKLIRISRGRDILGRRFLHVEDELVQVSEAEGVKHIKMVDSKTRNSLSLAMTSVLDRHITVGAHDTSLRCILISSSSSVFSAGHNLKEISNSEGRQVFYNFGNLMIKMIKCPVPIITVVDGLAAAAGCQLVAQSDIAIASPKAKFCTPGARFGVFCSTPGIPLVRAVPRKLAAYMLFTGNEISAERALSSGLVSIVAKENELEKEVEKVTQDIKNVSRVVVEHGKQFFYKQMEMNLSEAYQKGARAMDFALTFADGIEGLRSFSEKRKPNWKNLPYV